MLFLLKVLLDRSLYPDDASEEDERHWREDHKTVVNVTEIVYSLRDHLETEECTATEELTEESYDHEDHCISETVSKTVHEGSERLVAESECLDVPSRYSW